MTFLNQLLAATWSRLQPLTRALSTVLLSAVLLSCAQGNDSGLGDTRSATQRAVGPELIVNGGFSNGATSWTLGQWGGSSSGSVTGGQYKIAVTTAGSEWWNVQFMQRGLSLQQGKHYVVSFDAYKGPENTGTQSFVLNVGEDGGDYTSYFLPYGPEVTLTRTSTHYSFEFDMTQPNDPAARIEFNCGKNTGTFYFDNISLRETTLDERHLAVSATSLNFGSVSVGQTKSLALTLSNGGDLPTTVIAVSSTSPQFTTNATLPLTIPPGGSASLQTLFSPTAAAAASGSLTITSDATDNPVLTVQLNGNGVLPGLELTPQTIALSAREAGSAGTPLTLKNTASSPISWSLSAGASWLTAVPASGVLAAGAEAVVTISAVAGALTHGTYLSSLELTHGATNLPNPSSVPVQFTVVQGYSPSSPFIVNPELAIPFVEEIAAFRARARDNVNGGFYTFINRQGTPTTENTKSLCGQSRLGYAFTRAFALTGDEAYLDHAHHALKFLYDHGFNNGWYFVTNIQGGYIPHWGHNDWWSFQQHYALVGITAMVEVTGGELNWGDGSLSDKQWLQKGIDSNYNHLWDTANSGYFDHASTNWSNKWGKGFTPTVDAITTHALLMATTTELPIHRSRLFELADNIVDHLVAGMDISQIAFPEVYDALWNVDNSQQVADIGHHYKTAWCLQRAYLLDPTRVRYKQAADAIMWDLWNNGAYDREYGGPYSKVNWKTGVITDTGKNNWMLEQGITSGLISYYSASTEADKDMFLEVADGSARFFMEHQLDPVYGEAYSDVSRDGSSQVIADKGGLFNSGYHSIETGYYLYLYGNLFYHKKPATLHYKFAPTSAARNIRLTPLAIQDSVLKILSVELDSASYSNFDANTRTLSIPAGTGGVFRVTFTVGAYCGDGNVDPSEECDDGNNSAGDGCSPTCGIEAICGDGSVGSGESCDDGNADNTDACLNSCLFASCGDGFLHAGVEACDDGNTSNADSCLSGCVVASCGDGFVRTGVEQCDDANASNTDACLSDCTAATCGDGIVWSGVEQCDDGNADNTDGCLDTCEIPGCGDGFVQAGEICDDGNTSNNDSCLSTCLPASCGDGFLQTGIEECDDGNTVSGDGCDSACANESTCSDGIHNGDETDTDCGGSCDPCTCAPTVLAASALTYSTGGSVSDGYNIWSNGTGSVNFDFGVGDKLVTVHARGELAGGSGPHMVVSVGGVLIGELTISDPTMQAYTFPYAATGGVKAITVEFTNDYYNSPDDRNLIIGGLEIGCDGPGLPSGSGAFLESGGLVVMEAEHFDSRSADKTTNDAWSSIAVTSASGGMCMQVGPDSTTQSHTAKADTEANAARMGYEVDFTSTGTWRIWVRGASTTNQGGSSNSCHAGVDGVAQALYLNFPTNGSYQWVAGTLTISSPGVHTVNVFMREDGFIADKIILAKSQSYTPSGTGQPESPRDL